MKLSKILAVGWLVLMMGVECVPSPACVTTGSRLGDLALAVVLCAVAALGTYYSILVLGECEAEREAEAPKEMVSDDSSLLGASR